MTAVDEWAEMRAEAAPDYEALAASVKPRPARKPPAEKEKPKPKYETLPEFVAWITSWYRREVWNSTELLWCRDWWKHPEAALRLNELWHSFEGERQNPTTGLSGWLRDHADVHMGRLMQQHGPFTGCTPLQHSEYPLEPLPVSDPPEGWWTRADSGL